MKIGILHYKVEKRAIGEHAEVEDNSWNDETSEVSNYLPTSNWLMLSKE